MGALVVQLKSVTYNEVPPLFCLLAGLRFRIIFSSQLSSRCFSHSANTDWPASLS